MKRCNQSWLYAVYAVYRLVLSGDIESNPGPTCKSCEEAVQSCDHRTCLLKVAYVQIFRGLASDMCLGDVVCISIHAVCGSQSSEDTLHT